MAWQEHAQDPRLGELRAGLQTAKSVLQDVGSYPGCVVVDVLESSHARQLQSLAVGDDSSHGAELRQSRDLAS